MKKKSSALSMVLIFGAIFVLAVWYYVTEWNNIVNEFTGKHESIDTVLSNGNIDDCENGYYTLEVDAVLGCFATETKDNDVDSAYYIVWLSDNSLAAVSVRKSEMKELDRITEGTWAYVNGEKDSFTKDHFKRTVKVRKFGGDLHTLYTQGIENMGISDEDFLIRDIIFDCEEGGMIKHDAIIYAIFGLIGFLVMLVGVFSLIGRNDKETGTNLEAEAMEKVSYRHAKERITNPEIKTNYKKMKTTAVLMLVATALFVLIPAGLYAYTMYNNANSDASTRKATYTLENHEVLDNAKENETAQITIDSVPRLICSEDNETYYIIEHEGTYFIGIIDSKSFSKIQKELEETGEFTLYGFLQAPSSGAMNTALDILNSSNNTNYNYSDYDSCFGKYALNVDEDYAGKGIPLERIRSFMVGVAIFIIGLAIFGISSLLRYIRMIKGLRRISDNEYSQLERELSGGNCERYPQNLILTDSFLVMLYSYTVYKNPSKSDNETLFAKYSDIKWIYPANHIVGGKVANYGVVVFGPQIGKNYILALPNRGDNEATINQLLSSLIVKCPNAVVGYTEENAKKAGAR